VAARSVAGAVSEGAPSAELTLLATGSTLEAAGSMLAAVGSAVALAGSTLSAVGSAVALARSTLVEAGSVARSELRFPVTVGSSLLGSALGSAIEVSETGVAGGSPIEIPGKPMLNGLPGEPDSEGAGAGEDEAAPGEEETSVAEEDDAVSEAEGTSGIEAVPCEVDA